MGTIQTQDMARCCCAPWFSERADTRYSLSRDGIGRVVHVILLAIHPRRRPCDAEAQSKMGRRGHASDGKAGQSEETQAQSTRGHYASRREGHRQHFRLGMYQRRL